MPTTTNTPTHTRRSLRESKKKFFTLTNTHEKIIEYVHHFGLLSSVHIEKLTGLNHDWTRRVLQDLHEHHYLDWWRSGTGHYLYGLGKEGMKYLESRGRAPRNKNIKQDFKLHALRTSDFLVALELSCRKHHARIIHFDEILENAPLETQRHAKPYQWKVEVSFDNPRHPYSFFGLKPGTKYTLGVEPDWRVFGIEFLDKPEGANKAYFAFEEDLSNEPVLPKIVVNRANIAKKIVGYHATYTQGLHTAIYGIKNLRILTVVHPRKEIQPRPHERINNIIQKVCTPLNLEKKIFLFANGEELDRCEDLLTFEWRNHVDEKGVRLLV